MGISATAAIIAINIASIVTSTTLTVVGQKAQAKAVSDAAKARARAAREAGITQERELRRINRLELSAQRLRLARAGIQLTGSPLEVLASNAAEFEREAIEIRSEAGRVTALELAQARSAKRIGQLGVAATAVRGAGRVISSLASSQVAA